jgi:predicted O-methyltransferase YrrM
VVDAVDSTASKDIVNNGYWEPRNLRTMARFVKPGSHVLNAGSHIGLEAITLGRIAGPEGKLYIFEPVRTTYSIVLRNVYLDNLGNMATVYNLRCNNKYSAGVIANDLARVGSHTLKFGLNA